MQKILVEVHSEEPLENLYSLYFAKYDGVLYCGFADDPPKNLAFLQKLAEETFHCTFTYLSFTERSFPTVCRELAFALQPNCHYDFDLSGGLEMVIAAVGFLVGTSLNHNLSMHKYDLSSGKVLFTYSHGEHLKREHTPHTQLTVAEALQLQQTQLLTHNSGYHHLLQGDLQTATLALWQAVGKHPHDWNRFCVLPGSFSYENHQVVVDKRLHGKEERDLCQGVVSLLHKENLITKVREVTVQNQPTMRLWMPWGRELLPLLEKGGTLLESYIYCAAKAADCFSDVQISVAMKKQEEVATRGNTHNEIDVLAVARLIPHFISCKNKLLENDFLYEIASLAKYYGGSNAKIILVSNVENHAGLRRRAEDMHIHLIEDVQNLPFTQLCHKLYAIANAPF